MKAEDLAKITEGRLRGEKNISVSSFEFDTREGVSEALFIPLKGKRDGHDFIEDAFLKGALGTLTEIPVEVPEGKFSIEVEDTFLAFKKIAQFKRENFSKTLVAVTGSVGKTTTKELLFHLFSDRFKTYKNKKSFNNMLGVVYTLSNLPRETEVYIQELGTNAPGEIGELTAFVKPDISIVTAVERAHTEGLKDFDTILKEKMSITEDVPAAVVPYAFREFSKSFETVTFGREGDVRVVDLKFFPDRTLFSLEFFGKRLSFESPIPGYSLVNAAAVAVAVALILGVDVADFPERLKSFQPPEMRLCIERLKGVVLINDAYNANPRSMENAIHVLSLQPTTKVAVLGDMAELGEISREEHRKLGELLNRAGVTELVAFGEEIGRALETFKGKSFYFTIREEFINFINNYDFSGKAVLVKGSRKNRLEEVVKIIRQRYGS
ncbi:UDP-N-acetylmuramoyl-tripeptide--D-alanyl-D-alanine ligase [Phorcysia thermohydrogeniphila]|uniref:UDP-N-acetylmuramoyl-tripeptide--D-alanyl-D-alanine ligase n=1 Tax=Phorcysia thermohydrogeniphila TaxID=936138 RepID=A0A4R1GP74_9BACT|nr:UDP-N-acetylmuramoyl-tripeptide--D-alanyl-D-alanine ligase [Phorcysia thermohydrogeniphila]TCK06252.1 UDP-N-acetylmuramoyl-tripeptide--D-alanyl-D-alanine ligase [Phorcysia thermohydrogeniphila]